MLYMPNKKYGRDFDATVLYLGLMVSKNDNNVQPVFIAKTGSYPIKSRMMQFMGEIECKKYSKAV